LIIYLSHLIIWIRSMAIEDAYMIR
jgi:hypothetical protein